MLRGMARAGQVRVAEGQRLTDRVALGVLTATFPRALVDAVIEATGRREQRNRLLPAHLSLYYVLAMTLFSSAGYEEVMRSLTEGLAWTSDGEERYEVPSQVAITKARARLGPEPLAELFARACLPLATPATPGAFYRDRRLVSLDGTTIDVADTPANAESFGRAGTGRGDGSAFPQLRMVALGECGTHAIVAAALDSYGVAEVSLAKDLVTALKPGMLVLADRGFTAFPLWDKASATGADLLWRAKGNALLPVLQSLPDGSYRSEIVATADKRTRERVLAVRVVEYSLDDPGRPASAGTRYRLLTTILDPGQAPAAELAALYAQRWEIESVFDELKTHQRGPRVVLRSRTPAGVYQEAWGYLCVHYAIRALIHAAARHGDHDPDRLSFTRALHATRRSVRTGLHGGITLAMALRRAIAEILHALLPERRPRSAARVVRRKMSGYHVKRAPHRTWLQPALPSAAAIHILRPP
jgi:Insertion element 4 transposase N-terminal/Transposase DDE domain